MSGTEEHQQRTLVLSDISTPMPIIERWALRLLSFPWLYAFPRLCATQFQIGEGSFDSVKHASQFAELAPAVAEVQKFHRMNDRHVSSRFLKLSLQLQRTSRIA